MCYALYTNYTVRKTHYKVNGFKCEIDKINYTGSSSLRWIFQIFAMRRDQNSYTSVKKHMKLYYILLILVSVIF